MPTFRIITSAFGLNGIREIRYDAAANAAASNLNSGVIGSQRTSYLGTPIVSDLVLESTDAPFLKTLKVELALVLLTVSQTKEIRRTGVDGRAGKIKEYIADDDFEIKIQGALVNPLGSYPTEDVRNLVAMLLKPKAIKAISDYLLLFNIYDIVITSYSFGQKEGHQNLQFFEITAYSDTPENILLDA